MAKKIDKAELGVGNVVTNPQVEEPEVEVANQEVEQEEEVQTINEFAQILADLKAEQEANSVRTMDDIVKDLLVSGKAVISKNMEIRNVTQVAIENAGYDLLNIRLKDTIVGNIATGETDAFGQPIYKIGNTNNIFVSNYSIAHAMRESGKCAIFAAKIGTHGKDAIDLLIGGKCTIVAEFVKAGDEYVSPFNPNATPTTFDVNKIIHHIISVKLGEAGMDMYKARITAIAGVNDNE